MSIRAHLASIALLLFVGTTACSPGRAIVGYVTDVDGGPVVNAEIALVETGDVETSGADGRFELNVPSGTDSLTLRVDGWSSAGGPYSYTPIYFNDESWYLAPGGQAKAQVVKDGKVRIGVMAVLKKLERATSIPINPAQGAVVTNLNATGFKLDIPAIENPTSADASDLWVSITPIEPSLISFPQENKNIPLVAAYVDTDDTTLSESATLYLPLPSGIGNQASLAAAAFGRQSDQAVTVNSAVTLDPTTGLAVLTGITQTGYYFISLERN